MPHNQQRTNENPLRILQRLRALLIVLLVALALPAWAIDGKKTAVALAQQAAKAFEAGDMDRAAAAYLEAWHTDASEPNYLYGAARAEQSAGQRERAEEHYRQFVAMENADPTRVAKAKGYLTEFDGVRSDEKVQAGDRSAKRGEWSVAAAAYGEAWRLREDRLAILLKAARAAKESEDHQQATTWLKEYLGRAPGNAPDRAEAQAMLDALAGKRVVVAPVEKPPEPVEQKPQPVETKPELLVRPNKTFTLPPPKEKPNARRTAGIWTLSAGGVVAVTGAVLLIVGKMQESQFNADLNYDGQVVHGSVTFDDATSRAQSIGTLQSSGWALLGVGVATVGVGSYLLATSGNAQVSLVPNVRGFALAGRF